MKKIIKYISGIRYLIFNREEKYYEKNINGKKIVTVKGTYTDEWDADFDWYILLAKNSKKIYEIGSNMGQTALLALINANIDKILLVDPNPQALLVANKNVLINNWIHKTNSYLGFVGKNSGEVINFYTIGKGAAGSMYKSHSETASMINNFYKVATVTLDYLHSHFCWTPDFIKIDVEGAEALVISGGKELLKNNAIKVLVEMHANEELSMLENATKVLNLCVEINYSAWYLKTKERLTSPETISKRGRCHLLLLPKDIAFPSYLL